MSTRPKSKCECLNYPSAPEPTCPVHGHQAHEPNDDRVDELIRRVEEERLEYTHSDVLALANALRSLRDERDATLRTVEKARKELGSTDDVYARNANTILSSLPAPSPEGRGDAS